MDNWFIKMGNSRCIAWDGHKKYLSVPSEKSKIRGLVQKVKTPAQIYFISVVPALSKELKARAKSRKIQLHEIKASQIPIRAAYKKNLGVDRLMNVYSASLLTKKNLVVIDIGTAITVDFLNRKKTHLGGWISIGPHLASKALHHFTAKLPIVTPRSTPNNFGRNTKESLLIGHKAFLHGIILEATQLARKQFGSRFEIFLTGGGVHLLPKRYSIEYLGLQGLKRLAQM